MELIFTCHECGYVVRGDSAKALMLKVRMYNHINHSHPALVENFKEVVEESARDRAPA